MDVPAPLARVAALLSCPVCSGTLDVRARSLVCDVGHSYDIARHGHVTLVQGTVVGDDAEMVTARAAIQDAGRFAPLTAALARVATARGDEGRGEDARDNRERVDVGGAGSAGGVRVVLDVGAGTGHHLEGVLAALPGAHGIALDTSRPALRQAARRERIAAVVGDVWQGLPVQDGVVDLVLDVFAPRNADEFARVLRPGGRLVVAAPAPEHLAELAHLHGVQVDPVKAERLERTLGARLELEAREAVRWTMELPREDAGRVLRMGPAGKHLRAETVPPAVTATGAVDLWVYRRSLDVAPDGGARRDDLPHDRD